MGRRLNTGNLTPLEVVLALEEGRTTPSLAYFFGNRLEEEADDDDAPVLLILNYNI